MIYGQIKTAGILEDSDVDVYNAFRSAYLSELCKVAGANGGVEPWNGDFEKFASSDLLEEVIKEAFLRAIKNTLVGQKIPTGVMQGGKEVMMRKPGLIPQVRGAGGLADRARQAGKNMQMDSTQRMYRTGLPVSKADVASASAFTRAAGSGGTSGVKRVAGSAVEGAGKHVRDKSALGLAINPMGAPLGGAVEGGMHGLGREVTRNSNSRFARGASKALHRGAKAGGVAGEIAGVAGLGTALHAPLSAAGAVGGKMLGAAGVKGSLANAVGNYGAHVGADLAGGAAGKVIRPIAGAAKQVAAPFARMGRFVA